MCCSLRELVHCGQPGARCCALQRLSIAENSSVLLCDSMAGRLDSFFTIKPAEPGTKRKEPPTKAKPGAKAAKTGKKGGVGGGKKK
jgi:hypothetical protein